jgi:hypothetical protein
MRCVCPWQVTRKSKHQLSFWAFELSQKECERRENEKRMRDLRLIEFWDWIEMRNEMRNERWDQENFLRWERDVTEHVLRERGFYWYLCFVFFLCLLDLVLCRVLFWWIQWLLWSDDMIFALFWSFCVFFCLVFVMWDWFEDWADWAEDEDDWDCWVKMTTKVIDDWAEMKMSVKKTEIWDLIDWRFTIDVTEKKTWVWWAWRRMRFWWLWDCLLMIDDREKFKFREQNKSNKNMGRRDIILLQRVLTKERWEERWDYTDDVRMRLGQWRTMEGCVSRASFVGFEPWGAFSLWCAAIWLQVDLVVVRVVIDW